MTLEAVVFRRPDLGHDLGGETILQDWSWVYNSCFDDSPTITTTTTTTNTSSTTNSTYSTGRPLTPPTDNLKISESIHDMQELDAAAAVPAVMISGTRKRKRSRSMKNKEEIENQRMIHIAVERNRRKLMNQYLAALRSLMPPSYAQRGDQASIVGGAINFMKELEHHVQYLEGHKHIITKKPKTQHDHDHHQTIMTSTSTSSTSDHESMTSDTDLFSYFTHQYQTDEDYGYNVRSIARKYSDLATVEVTMAENHANLKVVTRRQPKQLSKVIMSLISSLRLFILHLNVTTVDNVVLYTFCLKVEDGCELPSANDVATAVCDMMSGIHEEILSIC